MLVVSASVVMLAARLSYLKLAPARNSARRPSQDNLYSSILLLFLWHMVLHHPTSFTSTTSAVRV